MSSVIAWPQQAGEADEGGRGNLSAHPPINHLNQLFFQQIASRFVPRARNDSHSIEQQIASRFVPRVRNDG